jgi:hypothetical protein
MVGTFQHSTDVLNSWKEIAAYLDRGIRTAQRWERHLNMPVHHIGKGKRSPVCAKVHELNFWLSTIDSSRIAEVPHSHSPAPIDRKNSPINNLRDLRLNMRNLSQAVAENSVRLRRETDALASRLTAMKSRITKA